MSADAELVSGRRWRSVLRRRGPALVLALGGLALVGGGLAAPDYETLLLTWGGTALFGAALVVLFGPTASVRADVAGGVYATLAANCRTAVDAGQLLYAPTNDGVRLVTGNARLVPVGATLVDRIEASTVTDPEGVEGRLEALLDGLVAEVELVDRASATVGGGEATVTARGLRLPADEQFDHPVASVVGVGLARTVDAAVLVETTTEDDALVVTARWADTPSPDSA